MPLAAALVPLAAIVSLACFAHHSGTPLDIEPVPKLPDHERTLVVAVRDPEIKLDPPLFEGDTPEPWTSLGELHWSISLIRSMRASELYREVDFEGQLACSPDLVLEVERPPRLASCDADAPMALLFLGVIPVWTTCDRGHYFARADGRRQRFEFPWHETQLFGWFPPVLNLLPGWTRKPPPRGLRHDAFRAFLLSHQPELLPENQTERDPACPPG